MTAPETQTLDWLPVWTLFPRRAELRIGIHKLLLASADQWQLGSKEEWDCKVIGVELRVRPSSVFDAIALIEKALSLPRCPAQASKEWGEESRRLEAELEKAKKQIAYLREQQAALKKLQHKVVAAGDEP